MNDEQKPKKEIGYTFGYVYASFCAVAAAVHVWKTVMHIRTALPEFHWTTSTSYTQGKAMGTFILNPLSCVFLTFAAIALFRKHRFCMAVVYTIAIGGFFPVLWHGIIPKELALWLIFNVPVIVYFRRRRQMFATSTSSSAV